MKNLIFGFLVLFSVCFAENTLDLMIAPNEIAQKIEEVALEIDHAYQGEELTVVMVMKGAVCVAADLIRKLHIPVTIEYVKASSYGQNGTSRGELKVTGLDTLDFEGKNILVVDDIFDTGHTMTALLEKMQEKGPKTLRSLVLLAKNVPRQMNYEPEYILFKIDNHFVVGYGLDYKEFYRGLPGIYCLTP